MRAERASRSVLLVIALAAFVAMAGCVHRTDSSRMAAEPAAPSSTVEEVPQEAAGPSDQEMVEEAISLSVDYYTRGLQEYGDGHPENSREWFDRSLSALLDVDPGIQDDPTLESHYRDLMENVHELLARWDDEAVLPAGLEPGSPVDDLEEVDPESAPALGEDPAEVVADIPIEVNRRVQTFLDLYQGKWRERFVRIHRRSGRYLPMIRRVLAEEGLPLDLAYIPHVESAFKSKALSRVRAYGLWQFMAATGRNYGLHIDYWVDERADPEKATRAAAKYLKTLHGIFDDWNLAMASYNAGEYGIQRAMRRSGAKDFWQLARSRYIVRETKNFVPAILAAIIIYRDPAKYGFDPLDLEAPWDYEEVTVDGPVDLAVLAECAGTNLAALRELNPALRRNVVYPGASSFALRVPPGRGEQTLARLEKIPPGQRIRQVDHIMRPGETLGLLARKYGTSVRAIQTANDIKDPRRVRAGRRLTIPLTDGVYAAGWLTSTEVDSAGRRVYTVRRGDNPYRIARRHRIPMDKLLAWNGMTRRSVIYPGQELVLQAPGTAPKGNRAGASRRAGSSSRSSSYVVRRGDSLSHIAARHGVALKDLLAWNQLHLRSLIRPGDRLRLQGSSAATEPPVQVASAQPAAPAVKSPTKDGSNAVPGPATQEYTVRRGDTPHRIARAHGMRLDEFLRANGLTKRSLIYPGQKLTLLSGPETPPAGVTTQVHVVKRGETLSAISRAYSVSVAELCRWNGISKRKVIHPGDRLTLHSR